MQGLAGSLSALILAAATVVATERLHTGSPDVTPPFRLLQLLRAAWWP